MKKALICIILTLATAFLYACGGDGTANEVLHGLIGFENASMTCYPCGSGNDYVKYYGGAEKFLDIEALLAGEEHRVDVMRMGHRYAINVINFGFDTAVARINHNGFTIG